MELAEFPNYLFHKEGYITSKKRGNQVGSNHEGYIICNLTNKDGVIKKVRLHRMIYWAHTGVNPGDDEVDHINGNSQDNRIENLQLLNKKEHRQKTFASHPDQNAISAHKRSKKVIGIDPKGNEHKFGKLSDAAAFVGKSDNTIANSCNYQTLVNGWLFKWDIAEEFENCEWVKVNIQGCEQDIYANDQGFIKTKRTITQGNYGENYRFSVVVDGKAVNKGVHYLVCTAFHGPMPDWATSVNHIDGDPRNNKPSNLEWSDAKKQMHHALGMSVTLTNDAGDIQKFGSLNDASEFLKIPDRRRLQRAAGNNAKLLGYTVEIEETVDRFQPKRVGREVPIITKEEKKKDGGTSSMKIEEEKSTNKEKIEENLSSLTKLQEEKELQKEKNREAARERMTGENNPNFGVEREVNHSRKIGEGTRRYHLETRKITDAQIDEIREARNVRKESTTAIATRYGFSTSYVSCIARGLVLKSTEQEDTEKIVAIAAKSKAKRESNVELGLEKSAIGRRKFPPAVIIEIISYKKKHPRFSHVYKSLQSEIQTNQKMI
jgi:hypothetical protein